VAKSQHQFPAQKTDKTKIHLYFKQMKSGSTALGTAAGYGLDDWGVRVQVPVGSTSYSYIHSCIRLHGMVLSKLSIWTDLTLFSADKCGCAITEAVGYSSWQQRDGFTLRLCNVRSVVVQTSIEQISLQIIFNFPLAHCHSIIAPCFWPDNTSYAFGFRASSLAWQGMHWGV
jgi:hypothetical protein